jgi:hypothetical protein
LSKAAKKLLAIVPRDGVFIGNTTLQRRSRLSDKRYWNIRRELVKGGFLIRGKGRGGSVARLTLGKKSAPAVIAERKKGTLLVARESELYEPLRKWLEEDWGKDMHAEQGDFFEVLVTATSRKKLKAGGQWSRPDVTVVKVNSYEYLPMPVLEVSTFEVKRFSDAEDLRSVFEAAAHSRWAHYSYLVVEVPDFDYELPERIQAELERFNIGRLFMRQRKKGRWQFEEQEWETDRLAPEPDMINALLETFFKKSKREAQFKQALRVR